MISWSWHLLSLQAARITSWKTSISGDSQPSRSENHNFHLDQKTVICCSAWIERHTVLLSLSICSSRQFQSISNLIEILFTSKDDPFNKLMVCVWIAYVDNHRRSLCQTLDRINEYLAVQHHCNHLWPCGWQINGNSHLRRYKYHPHKICHSLRQAIPQSWIAEIYKVEFRLQQSEQLSSINEV